MRMVSDLWLIKVLVVEIKARVDTEKVVQIGRIRRLVEIKVLVEIESQDEMERFRKRWFL